MTQSAFFQDVAMLMSVAGIIAVIFTRFGWPKVMGYILAGVMMSEHTWGGCFLADASSTQTIGQLGVVFLMFTMGLSFSAKDMKKIQSVVMPAAIVDTLVMIWLGYTVGTRFFGWSAVQSIFLGVAMCDSATTLLAKVIDEAGWGQRPFAKYVLGTSICEDIICVGAIAVATGFANGGTMSAKALFSSLGSLALFFTSVLVFGFILVPRLLRSVAKSRDDESLMLTVLGSCFFVSFFAYKYDFSLALGAFLVGILGASSELRQRLSGMVDPLKSMFSAIFFVSIGLLVDPVALMHNLPQILIVSAVVIAGKTINIVTASLATGVDVKTAIQNGLSLAQIGEFAFMVAILYSGIVGGGGGEMFQIAVGASLLTTLLNPTLIKVSDPLGNWVEKHLPERFARAIDTYRAWLAKLRSSEDTATNILLRAAAIKLGIYAVLVLSVSVVCTIFPRFDYSRFSAWFERYDSIFFCALANLFTVSMLPLVWSASRALGDEISVVLAGDGNSRWQLAVRQLSRFVVPAVVLGLFLVEWGMLNLSVIPTTPTMRKSSVVLVAIVGVVGWGTFKKAGRHATKCFQEALTAEERQEGLVRMMTITMPEGTVHRLRLDANSPAIGCTVVSLNIRAKTGASIVSVYRDGVINRNIGPEWEFRVGDVLVALGDNRQIAAAKDLLGVIS